MAINSLTMEVLVEQSELDIYTSHERKLTKIEPKP